MVRLPWHEIDARQPIVQRPAGEDQRQGYVIRRQHDRQQADRPVQPRRRRERDLQRAVPGVSIVNLPAAPCDCSGVQRQFRLELREGERVIWQDSRLPKDAPVVLQGRRCALTATVIGDQVRIEVSELRARIAAN